MKVLLIAGSKEQLDEWEIVVRSTFAGKVKIDRLFKQAVVSLEDIVKIFEQQYGTIMLPLTLPNYNSLRLAETAYRLQLKTRLVLCSGTLGPPGALKELFDAFIPAHQLSVESLRTAFSYTVSRNMQPPPLAKIRDIIRAGYLLEWQEQDSFGRYKQTLDVFHNRDLRARAESILRKSESRFGGQGLPNPWRSGSFYLLTAVVIMLVLALISTRISWYAIPVVLIAGLLTVIVIGAFQLRHDDGLSEKRFLELVIESLKRVPLLVHGKSFGKQGKDEPDKRSDS